jgi:hypothetical protein
MPLAGATWHPRRSADSFWNFARNSPAIITMMISFDSRGGFSRSLLVLGMLTEVGSQTTGLELPSLTCQITANSSGEACSTPKTRLKDVHVLDHKAGSSLARAPFKMPAPLGTLAPFGTKLSARAQRHGLKLRRDGKGLPRMFPRSDVTTHRVLNIGFGTRSSETARLIR